MEIKTEDIKVMMKKNIRVFSKNSDALELVKTLKRRGVKYPDKYSIVTWD